MDSERIFVIGDIHGCLNMLERLMNEIDWLPEKETLIFLGDYIDRGADSKGVVDYVLKLNESSCNVKCIIGNHEAMFMDYISEKDQGLFLMNGGLTTLKSYGMDKAGWKNTLVPPEHMAFYRSLETYVELDDYYIVHAGFRPGIDIKMQTLEDMIWIRGVFISSNYDFGKRVIFGHTTFYEPLVMPNKIGLDTGAVYGNKLTCLELPEVRFHSVTA